ncbi:UNVERIFIED_CONTAM: hypothetical protein C3P01_19095 [Clostridioides difficile]
MRGGDFDASITHYCIQKLKWKPGDYMGLEINERVLAVASILVKIEDEEEAMKEAERERKRGRRR